MSDASGFILLPILGATFVFGLAYYIAQKLSCRLNSRKVSRLAARRAHVVTSQLDWERALRKVQQSRKFRSPDAIAAARN